MAQCTSHCWICSFSAHVHEAVSCLRFFCHPLHLSCITLFYLLSLSLIIQFSCCFKRMMLTRGNGNFVFFFFLSLLLFMLLKRTRQPSTWSAIRLLPAYCVIITSSYLFLSVENKNTQNTIIKGFSLNQQYTTVEQSCYWKVIEFLVSVTSQQRDNEDFFHCRWVSSVFLRHPLAQFSCFPLCSCLSWKNNCLQIQWNFT